MASLLTTREMSETSALARRVGGYSQLVRLEREIRKAQAVGRSPKLIWDKHMDRLRVEAISG